MIKLGKTVWVQVHVSTNVFEQAQLNARKIVFHKCVNNLNEKYLKKNGIKFPIKSVTHYLKKVI